MCPPRASPLPAAAPTHQWRWRSECSPSLSVISAAFIALGRSCLLANTSSTASRSSSCRGGVVHGRQGGGAAVQPGRRQQ